MIHIRIRWIHFIPDLTLENNSLKSAQQNFLYIAEYDSTTVFVLYFIFILWWYQVM